MENLFMLILLASLILLIIGLFSPTISLFWFKKDPTWKQSIQIYGLSSIAAFILFGVTSSKSETSQSSRVNSNKNYTAAKYSEPAWTEEQRDSITIIEKLAVINERKDQTIKAAVLIQSYIDNEVRADDNFKGKNFYVEGVISDIKKDILDDIYVTLEGSEMFREVQCYFDDKVTASKLEKGMRVTFFGKCDGLMMNVIMRNCQLVENLKDLEKEYKNRKKRQK